MNIRNTLIATLIAASTLMPNAEPLKSGIDLTAVDKTVRPQDDFFQYVNGSWLRDTPIPADKSRLSMFSVLADQTDKQLQTIIQDAAKANAPKGSNKQKLGDMYKSFMDTETIEAQSYWPLEDKIESIQKLKNRTQVAEKMGELFVDSVSSPFGFYVYPDAKDPQHYGFWLFQSGLSLPDRDYYSKTGDKYKKARRDLLTYSTGIFSAVRYKDPQLAAQRLLNFETRLAKIQVSRVEARDAEKNYNKRNAKQVTSLFSGFDWQAYAKGSRVSNVDSIIVRNYPYFQEFGKLFASTKLQTLKDYMTFRLMDRYAPSLSKSFVDLHFGFHSTALNGVPENKPRWKRAVGQTSGALGEVLGQEYVARHFTPEAKAKMNVLVSNLIKAYGQSIQELEWMTDETKKKALVKLASFKPKVGYPDKWRDYSKLEIQANDFIGNQLRSAEFEHDYEVAKIAKPVDPVDWGITPQTINAYYSPTRNEIVFPAAILQPPFFNLNADDAVNYGGIGGVIGHEIGHGFDDQGSKYDGGGNLKNWWTPVDRKAFDKLGDAFVKQYDSFQPLEGQNVNGRLTLGENIGDLAGIAIGYKAYTMSLNGQESPVIDNLTGAQRFFMGWAQVWRSKMREDALRARLLSDPHSPAQYRVNGPLPNVDAFYQAFEVKEGDKMYLPPSQRVKIW